MILSGYRTILEDKKGEKRWRKPSFLFDVNEKPYFWELILGSVVQWIVFHPDVSGDSEDAGSISAGTRDEKKSNKRFLSRRMMNFNWFRSTMDSISSRCVGRC
jgi:hypothetical protein